MPAPIATENPNARTLPFSRGMIIPVAARFVDEPFSPDHSLGFRFGRYWCASDRASRWRGWRRPSGLEVAGYGLGRGTRRPAAQGGSLTARAARSVRVSWWG